MTSRKKAFGELKPAKETKVTATEAELLAQVENFLKETKKLADYSIQGDKRNVRFFIRKLGATRPSKELEEKIRLASIVCSRFGVGR